jgi:hypothetical protein
MKETREEKLRKYVRNFPCFTCLVRPVCVKFYDDGNAHIDTCNMFDKWAEKRSEIMDDSALRKRIMRKEILKTLRKEKERYAKSSKNR